MSIIHLRFDEPAFADLQDRMGDVTHLTGPFTIAGLEGGTVAGRPSLAIRIDLPDGRVVVQELTLDAWHMANAGIVGRFGGPAGTRRLDPLGPASFGQDPR